MFSKRFLDWVNRLIEVRLAERRKQIPHDISKVRNQATSGGTHNSSNVVLDIKEICEKEIELRAEIAWDCMIRSLATVERTTSKNLAYDMKHFLVNRIYSSYDELTQILHKNIGNMFTPEQVGLMDARNFVIEKYNIEVGRYVSSQRISQGTGTVSKE